MQMTIYTANCAGRRENNKYPVKRIIESEEDFCEAIAYDHVCSEFTNFHRSVENFVSADCLVMDCDNDHSENPKE